MQTNQQVHGTYCGSFKFLGVITSMRALTVRTDDCFMHTVKLNQPVMVYGEERTELLVHTKFDGTPSTYVRGSDSMTAVREVAA